MSGDAMPADQSISDERLAQLIDIQTSCLANLESTPRPDAERVIAAYRDTATCLQELQRQRLGSLDLLSDAERYRWLRTHQQHGVINGAVDPCDPGSPAAFQFDHLVDRMRRQACNG